MRQLFLACLMIAGAQSGGALGADIHITPLIHASVQIEYDGLVIQVDPWSMGDLTRALPADLILITDDRVREGGESPAKTSTVPNMVGIMQR